MDKGYFIFAQGEDYIRQAYALALSIKNTQKINSVCIAIGPDDVMPVEYGKVFDHVVMVKNVGLKHPMANEWQIWDLTPYKQTIHVEADMLFTSNIDWWWQELQQHDLFFTSHVKDYRGNTPTSQFYRKHFNKKTLPHLYNGFYYFKYSKTAHKFFNKAKEVSARYKTYADYFFAGTWYPATPTTDEIFLSFSPSSPLCFCMPFNTCRHFSFQGRQRCSTPTAKQGTHHNKFTPTTQT